MSLAKGASWMFYNSQFNGDLSQWDVGQVKDMAGMFCESSFNGDIFKWDVSNVVDMTMMFKNSSFRGDLSCWYISRVRGSEDVFKKSAKARQYGLENPSLAEIITMDRAQYLDRELEQCHHAIEKAKSRL